MSVVYRAIGNNENQGEQTHYRKCIRVRRRLEINTNSVSRTKWNRKIKNDMQREGKHIAASTCQKTHSGIWPLKLPEKKTPTVSRAQHHRKKEKKMQQEEKQRDASARQKTRARAICETKKRRLKYQQLYSVLTVSSLKPWRGGQAEGPRSSRFVQVQQARARNRRTLNSPDPKR